MEPLDVIVNEPDWMPISQEGLLREIIVPPPYVDTKQKLHVVVRELANGLLYAAVEYSDGKFALGNANYNTTQVSPLPKDFRLTQLSLRRIHSLPGFYATFEFKAGKAPDGQDAAWIEYTAWHNPNFGDMGLTRLLSLNAKHAIQGGWVDIAISSPDYWLNNRSMNVALSSSNESDETIRLDGNLRYDREGRLLVVSLGLPEAVERRGHPLGNVYLKTSNGAKIDALSTAATLVRGFPSQRPLDLLKLVQYKMESDTGQRTYQSRMFG